MTSTRAPLAPIPVQTVRIPVIVPAVEPLPRAALGLDDEWIFLGMFDHGSVIDRKNPIGTIQAFTQAYIMTGGGPNNSSLLYALLLYQFAFDRQQMGKASAMAWILFLILLIFTLIQFNSSKKWVHYEGADEG